MDKLKVVEFCMEEYSKMPFIQFVLQSQESQKRYCISLLTRLDYITKKDKKKIEFFINRPNYSTFYTKYISLQSDEEKLVLLLNFMQKIIPGYSEVLKGTKHVNFELLEDIETTVLYRDSLKHMY